MVEEYENDQETVLLPLRQQQQPQSSNHNNNNHIVQEGPNLNWNLTCRQLRLVQSLARSYIKESKHARCLLARLVVLMVVNAILVVVISFLNKNFYNALVAQEQAAFVQILLQNLGALSMGSLVQALYNFQKEQLAVHWREWMTLQTLHLYQSHRNYYRLEVQQQWNHNNNNKGTDMQQQQSQPPQQPVVGLDNPDQRIAQDIKSFTSFSLEMAITLATSFMDLVSFSTILWSIYPPLFGSVGVYSVVGTLLTAYFGRSLVGLNFGQLHWEADFRYSLVRWRTHAEVVAFYQGEQAEAKLVGERVTKVMDNQRQLNRTQRNLECFTNLYGYLVQILPYCVLATKYFNGHLSLGSVTQAASAFNHIVSSTCVLVNKFEELSAFSAGLERLSSFYQAMKHDQDDRTSGNVFGSFSPSQRSAMTDTRELPEIELVKRRCGLEAYADQPIHCLSIRDLTLVTPNGHRTLFQGLNLQVKYGDRLLITGKSGIGKSSLLRAIAGLWTTGKGIIELPSVSSENDDTHDFVYFLPQQPYCSLGTLREQLMYPLTLGENPDRNSPEEDSLLWDILEKVDLWDAATQATDGGWNLDESIDWSQILSLGEQQRLGFARMLYLMNKRAEGLSSDLQPHFLVILDEATSALDMEHEKRMYSILQQAYNDMDDNKATFISVGHRPSLVAFHNRRLHLDRDGANQAELVGSLDSTLFQTDNTLAI